MTRRARLRLVIVLVVLGVPALLIALGAWYLASGRLERRIAAEYRARLPGELSVGKVEVGGLDHAELLDVAVGPAGAPAIRAERVALHGSLAAGRIRSIAVEGLRVHLDAAALAWLREVAARAGGGGRAGAPPDLSFVVSGSIDVAGALPVDDLLLRGEVRHGAARARLLATLAQEPVELFLDHEDASGGARQVLDVRRATVRLAPLFHALEALVGMKNQDDVLEWLPAAAEIAGTRLTLEPGATTATGPFTATWRGGDGGGDLSLSPAGLTLVDAHAHDRELGDARGRLELGFHPVRLEVDVPAWSPGPRVPIPEQVPSRDLFALLPAAHLVSMEIDDEPHVYLTFAPDPTLAGTRHLDLWWQKHAPLRIFAEDLPARLAKPWIPKAIDLRDGRIARFDLRLDDGGLRSLEAVGDGVVAGGEDWSLVDLAPTVTLAPLPDDGGLDALIVNDGFSVRHRGDGGKGRLEIAVQALDALAAHLRGPRKPPRVKGAAKLDVQWRSADDGVAGDCTAFSLSGLAIGTALSGIEAAGRGSFAWRAGGRSARLDGQLTAGELKIAGKTVPLAVRTPQFTATVDEEAGQLALKEILARASGENGFTMGVHGRLNRETLDGELTAEIDRADLGWLSEHGDLVPLPKKAKLVGDVAMTATAKIAEGEVQRVDGWLLPLGTDLSLADGEVQVSGIKGAIAWHLAPPDAPAK